MKWCKAWKLVCRLVRADRQIEPETASLRAQFIARYDDVQSACALFSGNPTSTTAKYYTTILEQEKDMGWWQQNHRALAEPWFILRYCRQHALIETSTDGCVSFEPIVIRPENADETARRAQLVLERDMHDPEMGMLCLDSTDDDALVEILQRMRFSLTEKGYLRKVGECGGSLTDRAAETGLVLLQRGYTLYLTDQAAANQILAGRFAPTHRYWIRETSHPEILRLTYPRDKTLHQYVCAAGGRWNGKYMEFPISCFDRLGDLIRLYDFHITRTAERYINAWQQSTRQAIVYRSRRREEGKPRPTAEDVFQQLLTREIAVPDDILDSG